MKLVTFEPAPGCSRLGIYLVDKVVDLALAGETFHREMKGAFPELPSDMMAFLDDGDAAIDAAQKVSQWSEKIIKDSGNITSASGDIISYDIDKVRILAPVPRPPKIICLALNYVAHVDEQNYDNLPEKPYVFFKPGFRPVVGPDANVYRVPKSEYFTFEGELGVVIGKKCRAVAKEDAYDVIAGYTAVNDMSARDLGKTRINNFDWFRAKAFDSSLPMGPCLTLKDEIADPHDLRLQVRVNGEVQQDAPTSDMLFKIPETIEFITDFITLDPGDVIATGTPGGSKGALKAGDEVEVDITNIGKLKSIIAEREW